MVLLVVKRGDEDLFIYKTNVNESSGPVISDITAIYNGRLKVYRICSELEELCEHGTMLPREMMGLTDEQTEELKLVDVWATQCVPSGGFVFNKDPLGRRNGQQPQENMRNVLKNAMTDAKELINEKFVLESKPLTLKIIEEALNLLRGAVTIVYPMQLPPHDTIRMELTNTEDLSDMQASREVIDPSKAQLWFTERQVSPDSILRDFIGANDNTKVIVNLNSYGEGPPGREPVFTEDVIRRMMVDAYRREEELKTQPEISSTTQLASVDTSVTEEDVVSKIPDMDTDLIARSKSSADPIDTVTESVCKDVVCETREHKPQLEGEETTSLCSDMPIHLASFIESMLNGKCYGTGLKGEKFVDKLKELRNYLEADIMACDAKWTLFVAAAHSYRYRELVKPFPPRYIHETSHKPMIYPVNLVIIKTSELKNILQDIREMNYENLNAAVIDLLHYVLVVQGDLMLHTLTQSNIGCLLRTLRQGSKVPRPSHAFKIYNSTITLGDQSVKNFGSPMWAFYASELENFFSICTQGATQEPLLLYTDLENSLKMSPTGAGWGGSGCGSRISCVAVCEFDNMKDYVTWSKDGSVIKVAKKDLVRARYLLFYGYRLSELDIRPPATWIELHSKKISAAATIVVISAIAINFPILKNFLAPLPMTANYILECFKQMIADFLV